MDLHFRGSLHCRSAPSAASKNSHWPGRCLRNSLHSSWWCGTCSSRQSPAQVPRCLLALLRCHAPPSGLFGPFLCCCSSLAPSCLCKRLSCSICRQCRIMHGSFARHTHMCVCVCARASALKRARNCTAILVHGAGKGLTAACPCLQLPGRLRLEMGQDPHALKGPSSSQRLLCMAKPATSSRPSCCSATTAAWESTCSTGNCPFATKR